jgi:hypothetical protein
MAIVESTNKDGVRSIAGESDTVPLGEAHRRLKEIEAKSPWLNRDRPLVVAPPPVGFPPRPDEADLRRQLRNAIAEHDRAQHAAGKAGAAEIRAATKVAAATSELAAYAGIDEELAQLRADIIRSDSDDSVLEIPSALGRRLRERTEKESELASLGKARALLAGEADAARAALAEAEAVVAKCAAAVLVSQAETIADHYEELKALAQDRLEQLLGVAAVWTSVNGKQGPLQLGGRLSAIIAGAQQPLHHDPKWHGLLRALHMDAEARFE